MIQAEIMYVYMSHVYVNMQLWCDFLCFCVFFVLVNIVDNLCMKIFENVFPNEYFSFNYWARKSVFTKDNEFTEAGILFFSKYIVIIIFFIHGKTLKKMFPWVWLHFYCHSLTLTCSVLTIKGYFADLMLHFQKAGELLREAFQKDWSKQLS